MINLRLGVISINSRIFWRSFHNLRSSRKMSCTNGNSTELSEKILNISTVNPKMLKVEYAVRGPITIRAAELQKELEEGQVKPFKRVIKLNIGDCHALGQKPITYLRSVLSCCLFPEILKTTKFSDDIVERVQNVIKGFNGSLGCYTDSMGSLYVRNGVAKYIEKRDGYPANPNNIFLTSGASGGIKMILYSIIRKFSDGKPSGIMVPIPQYPLYSASISEYGGELVSYYLDEKKGWSLNIEECERALKSGRSTSNPLAMVVINPGNPTGQVLPYENMVEIVKFCKKNKLLLMVDEVYQENIYDETLKFHSFKKVVLDLGYTDKNFEMVSFHSISKGFYGECGLRGGYMELFGFDEKVRSQLIKLCSASLCSSTPGQVLVNCMTDPPKQGDSSYDLFSQEREEVLQELKTKAEYVFTELNLIPGITVNRLQGAMYAYPKLDLPEKLINEAKSKNMEPDEYYCFSLLEETGLCMVPGSGFKQEPGTFHFRTTILPPMDSIKEMVRLLKDFNTKLMDKYQ